MTGAMVIVVMNLPVPDDRRVWAQAEALRDDGVAVTVVCPAIRGKTPGTAVIDGIRVVYFRSFEGAGALGTIVEGVWTTLTASRTARRAVRRGGARALQVCNPPDMLAGLLRWGRRRGCLTVYDQHDVVPALAASRDGFRRLAGFFAACERRTVAAADVLITPSRTQAERLRERYGRTAVVVRTAPVAPSATAPASPAPRADGATTLGYLGVIGEQDGVSDLIDAVDALRTRGVNGFRVDIAGDGPALPTVRERAARLGLDGVVRFRGWLDHDALGPFLDGVDAMVVPDPDLEFNHYCAMNKVTHAMARGIPVVLRPLRENVRLTAGGGVVARDMTLPAFADAIETLLAADPGRRAAVGARLRRVFDEELTWAQSAGAYLAAVAVSPTEPRRPARR